MLVNKQYGLINLPIPIGIGNVLTTVSDRKLPHTSDNITIDYYTSDITSAQDYYAFGQLMPGRNWSSNEYKFGFNGKEKDDKVSGTGNQYDYGFRIYNPRIAKFLSVDPLTKNYPWYTPYQFAGNTPIQALDLDGLEILGYKSFFTLTVKKTGATTSYELDPNNYSSYKALVTRNKVSSNFQNGSMINYYINKLNLLTIANVSIPPNPNSTNFNGNASTSSNTQLTDKTADNINKTMNEPTTWTKGSPSGNNTIRENNNNAIGGAVAMLFESGCKYLFSLSPMAKTVLAKADIDNMISAYNKCLDVLNNPKLVDFSKVNKNWDNDQLKVDIANYMVDKMTLPENSQGETSLKDYQNYVSNAGTEILNNNNLNKKEPLKSK